MLHGIYSFDVDRHSHHRGRDHSGKRSRFCDWLLPRPPALNSRRVDCRVSVLREQGIGDSTFRPDNQRLATEDEDLP